MERDMKVNNVLQTCDGCFFYNQIGMVCGLDMTGHSPLDDACGDFVTVREEL